VVLILLLVLLALTVGAAFLHIPSHNWGILIAMTIAIAKGLLIILYFMHVKFGAKQTVAFATAGFLWLGILLTLTMADYITRNHPADLNYKGEPRYLLQDVNRR
jgi:cytochrome c oxidase subunit 4